MGSVTPSDDTMDTKGLVNKDGNYVLQTQNFTALKRYVATGTNLPTTAADFQTRQAFTSDQLTNFKNKCGDFQLILNTYSDINTHCTTFNTTTYPSVVDLSNKVYNLATNAGGKKDGSYYWNIITAAKKLIAARDESPPDNSKISDLQTTVQSLVDLQVKSINELQTASNTVKTALTTFETQCTGDQTNLNTIDGNLKKQITGTNGEIATLYSKIQSERSQVQADMAAYEQDVIIATTALTYAFVFPVGTVAAATIMGVYGDRARKMQAEVSQLNADIDTQTDQLYADTMAVTEFNTVKNDIDSLIAQIGPAIETIQLMEGFWGQVAGDLAGIRANSVASDSPDALSNAAVQSIAENKIVEKWNTLAKRTDAYRTVAYVDTIPTKTMADYLSMKIADS